MRSQTRHITRVRKEMYEHGVSRFGLMKFNSHFLPHLIHEDEHVKAIVYGRYHEDAGWLSLTEGMLVATDYRVIFLDHKPGYTTYKELGYDVISGVSGSHVGLFSAMTLYTKIGAFTIRYANKECVERFTSYVEKRRLTSPQYQKAKSIEETAPSAPTPPRYIPIDQRALKFIHDHDTGVLSTVNSDGSPHGTAMHYASSTNGTIFLLTKSGSKKARNILSHEKVAFTIYDTDKLQTLQFQGYASHVTEEHTKNEVFAQFAQPRRYGESEHFSPVTALHEGAFIVIMLTPINVEFSDYSKETEVTIIAKTSARKTENLQSVSK